MINQKTTLLFLKISTVLILIAKGITFITEPEVFGMIFQSYRTAGVVLGSVAISIGLLHLLPLQIAKSPVLRYALILSTILLALHSYCGFIRADYVFEQLVEHSLQVFLPLVYLRFLRIDQEGEFKLHLTLAVLVALTFVGHALFALGLHYVPHNFIAMTTAILGISQAFALDFLFTVGILDILCALALFVPVLRKYALYYLIFWGIVTAVARLWYGIVIGAGLSEIFSIYLPNMVYRLPHGLIPLLLLFSLQPLLNKLEDNTSM